MSHVDLECGGRSAAAVSDGDDEESICFSDADEGSCHSQFYSATDGSFDDCGSNGCISESRRMSEVAESDCSVEFGDGISEIKVGLERVERDCRICHLSLESRNPAESIGIAIDLGCSCKDDLAAAHKNCAETWFRIKGNKTCEICNSIARNVFAANEIDSTQQTNETNATTANTISALITPSAETQGCLNGHGFVNLLLGCMIFAFVISWLFRFNIPS